VLDGERNQLIPSAPPQGGRSRLGSHTHACEVYHIPSSKTILAHPCGLGSLRVAPLVDRERRVGCSMDSSCELLCSLDPASVSVYCCEVPCRISKGG
jgi:hypothetical protein